MSQKNFTPTQVDFTIHVTQDQGSVHDPVMNAMRAAITVAVTLKAKEMGLGVPHVTFHSSVDEWACV